MLLLSALAPLGCAGAASGTGGDGGAAAAGGYDFEAKDTAWLAEGRGVVLVLYTKPNDVKVTVDTRTGGVTGAVTCRHKGTRKTEADGRVKLELSEVASASGQKGACGSLATMHWMTCSVKGTTAKPQLVCDDSGPTVFDELASPPPEGEPVATTPYPSPSPTGGPSGNADGGKP